VLPCSSASAAWVARNTRTKTFASFTCPPVSSACNGIPFPSQIKWIFVLNPPRERPNASSPPSPRPFFSLPRPTGGHAQSCHPHTRVPCAVGPSASASRTADA